MRRQAGQLVLEVPAQTRVKALVLLVFWLLGWPIGALTFTYGRRAVRCGRNFGTRKARLVVREVRCFLGEPNEGEPPKKRPEWLIVVTEETAGAPPPTPAEP